MVLEFSFKNVKGVIFDLDDTLVKTQLDFIGLKQEINCPTENDILTFIEGLSGEQANNAHKIVLAHEINDAHTSKWMPGAKQFVELALQQAFPLAIVTRNCEEATRIKLVNNKIPIDLVLTREDAPPKPDPTALLQIAEQWNVRHEAIAYIGDYKYDIQAAHNANMQAWLFQPNKYFNDFASCLRLIPKTETV